MVDPITGIDTEKAGIADIVNRQNVGASQRARNELIRQQTQSGKSPDLSSLYSTSTQSQSEFKQPPLYYDNTNNEGMDSRATVKNDVFGRPYGVSTIFDSPINPNDPYAQYLNSKFKYNPGQWTPYTDTPFSDTGSMGRIGAYGSWDLGNNLRLIPKMNQEYLLDKNHPLQDATPGFLQQMNSKIQPLNPDGTINPEGWQVVSTKSQAVGHILGTLGVLAAPVMSYYGITSPGASEGASAASTGTAASIPAGSEGLMTGMYQSTAPTLTQSSGMFGQKGLDLGNKYLNKAAEGALKGFLFSGGNPTAALQGGLVGPLGAYTSDTLNPYVGNFASKALGGAASGALSSLFTKNSPIAGSLFGGMSGGLNAYLNSVNANGDPFNKLVTNTTTGLLRKKLFRK